MLSKGVVDSLTPPDLTENSQESLKKLLFLAKDCNSRDSDSALLYAHRAVEMAVHLGDIKNRVLAIVEIGLFYENQSNTDLGMKYYDQALMLVKNKGMDSLSGLLELRRGKLFNIIDKNDEAEKAFQKSIEHYRAVLDSAGLANSLREQGLLFWRLSEYEKAIKAFEQALAINYQIGNKEMVAANLNSIGVMYWQSANYEKSLEYYLQSLEMRRELEDLKGECLVLNNIGLVYIAWDKIEQGRIYIYQAWEKSQTLQDDLLVAGYTTQNMGSFWEINGNLDSAYYYYQRAYTVYSKGVPNNGGITMSMNSIANILNLMHKYDRAYELANEALVLSRHANNKEREANSLKNIANAYRGKKDYVHAIEYYLASSTLAKNINQRRLLQGILLKISETYKEMEQWQSAFEYFQKYVDIKDSLFNESNSRIMQDMQIKYEMEQKEKENFKLRTLQELQEADLKRQRLLIMLGLIILALIILLSIILLYINRVKSSVNEQLTKSNSEVSYQRDILATKTIALQDALNKVKVLNGLLPICANCKKIRDDAGYWKEVETYIGDHADVSFSHGICPDCIQKLYPELETLRKKNSEKIHYSPSSGKKND